VRCGQRDKHPAVVHLVIEPDGGTPGLARQLDGRGYIAGPDDVIGRLPKFGGGAAAMAASLSSCAAIVASSLG